MILLLMAQHSSLCLVVLPDSLSSAGCWQGVGGSCTSQQRQLANIPELPSMLCRMGLAGFPNTSAAPQQGQYHGGGLAAGAAGLQQVRIGHGLPTAVFVLCTQS